MSKQAVRSEAAPQAIGPYSQAVRSGSLVFLSGQIGLDPNGGDLVPGGTAAEAERALLNLEAVLAAAGLGFDDVVRVTIYLVDLADFAAVNDVYGRHLRSPVSRPRDGRSLLAAARRPRRNRRHRGRGPVGPIRRAGD